MSDPSQLAQKDVVGLIIALVVANWSAIGTALRCRDKIDGARNLLLGLSGNETPKDKETVDYIARKDICEITYTLTGLWFGISLIFVVFTYYMWTIDIPVEIVGLYGLSALGFMAGCVLTGVLGTHDYRWTRDKALKLLGDKVQQVDDSQKGQDTTVQ